MEYRPCPICSGPVAEGWNHIHRLEVYVCSGCGHWYGEIEYLTAKFTECPRCHCPLKEFVKRPMVLPEKQS